MAGNDKCAVVLHQWVMPTPNNHSKMHPLEDSNKEDERRAMSMAVANLVLALHFGLLTFLCDNMFKKGFASSWDIDHATFMKLYRCSNCYDMTSFSVRPKVNGSKEST